MRRGRAIMGALLIAAFGIVCAGAGIAVRLVWEQHHPCEHWMDEVLREYDNAA